MALAAGIELEDAQALKEHLRARDLFDERYRYEKDGAYIWFPVLDRFEYEGVLFEDRDLPRKVRQRSWREAARDCLTREEHAKGRFGYDVVGTIAIVEIPDSLAHKEGALAQLLLECDVHVSTVLKKRTGHLGALRVQPMQYLAGVDTRETVVSENGVRLKINVEEVYYSVRLGTERNRIMKLIRAGERVLCMFSGAGPYPIVFAKNTSAKELVGVELNKKGHELAEHNKEYNKVSNVKLLQGDVKEVVPKLEGFFDRITMPLPHTGEEFLPLALEKIAPRGVIHYYAFIDKGFVGEEEQRVKTLVETGGKKIVSIKPVVCGQHSPRRYRVCFDIIIDS